MKKSLIQAGLIVVGILAFGVLVGIWMYHTDPRSIYNFEKDCKAYGGKVVHIGGDYSCWKNGKKIAG